MLLENKQGLKCKKKVHFKLQPCRMTYLEQELS